MTLLTPFILRGAILNNLFLIKITNFLRQNVPDKILKTVIQKIFTTHTDVSQGRLS